MSPNDIFCRFCSGDNVSSLTRGSNYPYLLDETTICYSLIVHHSHQGEMAKYPLWHFLRDIEKICFSLSFYTMQFETELCIMTYCKSYINVFLSFEMTIGRNFLLSWTNIYLCNAPLKISERIFININPFINNGTNIFYQWSTLVLSRLNCSILP